MNDLSFFAPERVFSHFAALSAIPHGSGNTKAISDYCVAFAKQNHLSYHQDALGNVLIQKPAAKAYAHCPPVILQGHLDMVCVKEPDCDIDFLSDGLRLRTDGDFLFAEGTSLGGDDGIGVAMILALLENHDVAHPPLEALLTVDEETGMDGAIGFDASLLRGKMLLNLDSEEQGVLTVGCAGGVQVDIRLALQEGACAQAAYQLSIFGLRGGHSGSEIAKGRANAAILLGRIAAKLNAVLDARLVRAQSGCKNNAIAESAQAVFALDDAQYAHALSIIADFSAAFQKEFAISDPDLCVQLVPCGVCDRAFTVQGTKRAALFLSLLPNGVYSMSQSMQGLPQSSDNLGILSIADGVLSATVLVRSSLESEKALLCEKLRLLTEALGGTLRLSSAYPAWEYRADSPLRQIMLSAYQTLYGKTPQVVTVHGGLECGIFAGKIKDLDAVSFGPDILDIHTTNERLRISSVKSTWEYLLFVLEKLCK